MDYRITVYDEVGEKDIVCEHNDEEIINFEADMALNDLFSGSLTSVVISRITGRTGMRNDL